MKAELLRDRADRRLGTGQEMPAGGRLGAAISFEVGILFRKRQGGSFARIDAEKDDFEIVARRALDVLEGFHQPICNEPAQHWAAIIARHKDHRFAMKILVERDGLSGFIDEWETERELLIELLLETNLREVRRLKRLAFDSKTSRLNQAKRDDAKPTANGREPTRIMNSRRLAFINGWDHGRSGRLRCSSRFDMWRGVSLLPRTGSPRCTSRSIAREIGSRTIPAVLSIQA